MSKSSIEDQDSSEVGNNDNYLDKYCKNDDDKDLDNVRPDLRFLVAALHLDGLKDSVRIIN